MSCDPTQVTKAKLYAYKIRPIYWPEIIIGGKGICRKEGLWWFQWEITNPRITVLLSDQVFRLRFLRKLCGFSKLYFVFRMNRRCATIAYVFTAIPLHADAGCNGVSGADRYAFVCIQDEEGNLLLFVRRSPNRYRLLLRLIGRCVLKWFFCCWLMLIGHFLRIIRR